MMNPAKRLLILSCSRRKRPDPHLLPAIERYDGPMFRVLRRFLMNSPQKARLLDVLILSARFGLILASETIPNYDWRMTRERAAQLRPEAQARLERIFERTAYEEVFICLGSRYREVLDGRQWPLPGLRVKVAEGSIGMKLAGLRDWLYEDPPPPLTCAPKGSVRLRGVEVELTTEEILDIAHRAIENQVGEPANYRAWYVQVSDQRVSAKWLVSQLTGLPVSTFGATEARRMLTQLGIEVRRV